jgi:hypothetical protein
MLYFANPTHPTQNRPKRPEIGGLCGVFGPVFTSGPKPLHFLPISGSVCRVCRVWGFLIGGPQPYTLPRRESLNPTQIPERETRNDNL